MAKKYLGKRYKGCNEDCFNCPYPDCYKPTGEMKRDKTLFVSKGKREKESQGRMYTLSLGGYGGATPNASRKYYV